MSSVDRVLPWNCFTRKLRRKGLRSGLKKMSATSTRSSSTSTVWRRWLTLLSSPGTVSEASKVDLRLRCLPQIVCNAPMQLKCLKPRRKMLPSDLSWARIEEPPFSLPSFENGLIRLAASRSLRRMRQDKDSTKLSGLIMLLKIPKIGNMDC